MSRFAGDRLNLGLLTYSNGRPVLRGDVCLWYHVTPFRFMIGPPGREDLVTIPAFDPTDLTDAQLVGIRCRGVTDLASIPFPGRGLLPPNGGYVEAAAAHDDGYVSKGWQGKHSRAEVDQMLLDLMIDAGVPWWRRQVVYSAVRAFGWKGWGT